MVQEVQEVQEGLVEEISDIGEGDDDMPALIHQSDSEDESSTDEENSGLKWKAYDPSTVPKDYGLGKYWDRLPASGK